MFNQHRFLRVLQLIAVLKAKPPKTYQFLAEFLEASSRTVYRYMDLLKAVGIKVERGPNFTYYIPDEDEVEKEDVRFSNEEIEFLEKLISRDSKTNALAQGLVEKIRYLSETVGVVKDISKAHISKIIEDLSTAIADKRQVVLKQYQSASSQTISDRLVEPVAFTPDFISVGAFEVSSKMNKYFNIERISRVEILDKKMKYTPQHAFHEPDVFGFQGSKLDKEVSILLSMRAYLIFREQYPRSRPFIKEIPELKSFHFKAYVQDYQAPGRFALGFPNEVEVIGSDDFIKYVRGARKV